MATIAQILTGTFGVQALSPLDPGIQKLAEIRSGEYPGLGEVTITPESEVAQLTGVIADPLKGLEFRGNEFLDVTLPGILAAVSGAVAGFGIGGAFGTGLKTAITSVPKLTALQPQGGTMAFQDGDSGFFPSFGFGDLGKVLQGGLGQELLSIGTTALSGLVSQQFGQPQVLQTSMAAVPAVTGAMRVVGRSFFNRFPNLATAIQGYINRGIPVTRAKLWSLLKRFGPEFLITGAILTAAAVSELMVAGPGRRRMNPGNVKALRRAHRRMKAFHNVCRTNDMLLTPRRRVSKACPPGRTQITQVK